LLIGAGRVIIVKKKRSSNRGAAKFVLVVWFEAARGPGREGDLTGPYMLETLEEGGSWGGGPSL